MDIEKWLARQRKSEAWQAGTDGQRGRLEQLGITPEPEAPAKPSKAPRGGLRAGRCSPDAVHSKSRRAKLTNKLQVLANLGLHWTT
ncbi:hypothetical protein [Streptomyces sp. NBC_01518]|uniref:hypothetical protein n=1 Tax=Streptomyces sp. NBC_01518 TaxID=2903891 RepID=UPI00386D1758